MLAVALVAGCAAVLPFLRHDLGQGVGPLAVLATASVLVDVLVAGLLFARFLARGSALPLVLGCTFLALALVAVARALVLPGLGADGVPAVDAGAAAGWLWLLLHAALPLGIAAALWGGPAGLRRALAAPTLRRPLAAAAAAAGTSAAAAAICVAIVLAGDNLPVAATWTGDGSPTTAGVIGGAATLLIDGAVLLLAAVRGRRSVLEQRLPIVAGCVLAGSALAIAAERRYTTGWYASAALELVAAGIVLAALLADPARLSGSGAADARAAARDPLTGVASRAAALVAADHLHRTRAPGSPLALVLVDVDALRTIEDAHGALAADAVLLTVAERLRSQLRDEDLLARSGEEGFLIVLPETDVDGATLVADRAIAAIREQPVGTWAHDVRTTASGGVAVVGDGEHAVAQAMVAADLALNQAKAHGRDQVVSPARALVVPLRRAAAAPRQG
ncbi:MAG TPA: sensor domain-containing diguanylate cyclase [Baekduia sp.]|nr:sensor domain-containing diguanylate cyclase [Baekduia sp.]